MAHTFDSNLTRGSVVTHFRRLAVPAAMGMLFNTLYNIVDMYFAGMLSTSAQAGISLGYQAFYIALSVGVGLGAAMGALVGNALGAGARGPARRFAVQGLGFGVLAALFLAAAGQWFGPFIVTLVSDPGDYRDAGTRYFQLLSLALPAFFLAFCCNGILQAHGDSKSFQRALMWAFFANVGLNPLLIYGVPGAVPGLGFDGLALSTVASQCGVMVYMVWQVLKRRNMRRLRLENFRPNAAIYSAIAQQTLPIALSMMVLFLSGFVVQYALKEFGEHAVAGFGVAIRIEQVLLLPVMGLTGALLPIVAQNFGARAFDRIRQAVGICMGFGLLMTILASVAIWVFGKSIMGLFTDDPDVIRVGLAYLRIDSLLLPIYMALFTFNSLLQALKRPIWTVWISMYRQGIGIGLFVWIFVGLLGFDEHGVFIGVGCAVFTGSILASIIVHRVAKTSFGGLFRNCHETIRPSPKAHWS
ncbi:MATE family efflux transporter [Pararhodobacter oceanensis]|uniref:MATE family efflux transporter n=1 Tax=Pararhodobacter oceanensis TaxID=2172121 RepID=UPI003A901031